jgi:hypothetical protein
MKFVSILVTRSKSCHVKTLHTILRMNIECIQSGHKNEIIFVNDDPYAKAKAIENQLPTCDRIFFVDFGIGFDEGSIKALMRSEDDFGCLVFPGVTEGIDWDAFKQKVKSESAEPVHQMGLNFDTEVGDSVSEDIRLVENTSARAWVMNCRHVIEKMSDPVKAKKFGVNMIPPRMDMMFFKCKQLGVNIIAYTAAKLTMTYSHECVSSIINAAGVKTT